jgi:bacillithiol system protein YtxJ
MNPFMSNWTTIDSIMMLEKLDEQSVSQAVIIFKHSTRCSISSAALGRLQRDWNNEIARVFYLDLIAYRDLSNLIAKRYHVQHQSPQILVIKNRSCIYHASHLEINASDIIKQV